ncbi:MAG: outer membrane protein transport protein [Gammaproteobacteria bacterium]|nr:outer membrane protein transport protein [Gammaproteobacteria bacterium]
MQKTLQYSLITLAIMSAANPVNAAGFKLFEQSTSAMGNAYAGRGAQITDASVGFTNPAALIKLGQAQYVVGLNVIAVDGELTNASAASANGAAVTGDYQEDLGSVSLIPHFHYYQPLSDTLGFGLSVAVPYATSSEYDDDFVGRYFAQQTELKVITLQPAVSWKLNDKLSLGGAIGVNFASGTLSKYKDHSGLCEANAIFDSFCDSFYEVSGSDIQPSYTFGIHYQSDDSLAVALSYHSAVSYTLEGDSTITNTPVTNSTGLVYNSPGVPSVTSLKTEESALGLDTPASIVFSLDKQINPELSIQFTTTWTQWSEFTDISIISTDTGSSISASTEQAQNLNSTGYIGYIPEYWEDSWAFALGITYQLDQRWTLKSGIAKDFSPVNNKYRSARIPANDRTWLTVGGHYQANDTWSIDFATGVMFMKESSVHDNEYNVQNVALFNNYYQADYNINAYVVSLQFNYNL